ncbi:MAG: DUF6390 family protein, partial [Dehalococcoidia bacterium]
MSDGRLLFSHYALMPNRLGYCGGSDSRAMLEYCEANQADLGLEDLIKQFQAAYPYLQFIAKSNEINNPLDPRVVEAYWVGNPLLDRVDMRDFRGFIAEKFGPRVSSKALDLLIGKAPVGARPHHSFHVLDVSMRTGALRESLEDLDRCRISWGQVDRVEGDTVLVSYQPLVFRQGLLTLGDSVERRAFYRMEGKGYLAVPNPGDCVSL